MKIIHLNMQVIRYAMLLKNFMEWMSWLAWDERSTGKESEKLAEELPETVLSRRGTVYGKGNMVIFHSVNTL